MKLAVRWICPFLLTLPAIEACGGALTPQDAGAPEVDADPPGNTGGAGGAGGAGGQAGGADAGRFDIGNATCAEQTRAASMLMAEAVRAAEMDSLSCDTDADCKTVSIDTDCSAACGASVALEGAARIRAAIDRANATVCQGFAERGCKVTIPPCVPPDPWVCLQGACWGVLH